MAGEKEERIKEKEDLVWVKEARAYTGGKGGIAPPPLDFRAITDKWTESFII